MNENPETRSQKDKEEAPKDVPYIVFEGEQVRHERTVKRLIAALVVAIVLMVANNLIWLWAWMQYDYTSEETVTVDGKDGIANYIGENGTINNGKGGQEDGSAQGEEVG